MEWTPGRDSWSVCAGLPGKMKLILSCIAVICAFLVSCALSDWVEENFPVPIDDYPLRDSYHAALPAAYTGAVEVANVDELIASHGPPDLILEARPRYGEFRDGIPAVSYIYKPRDGRPCFDTFVVIMTTGTVARHYCR